MDKLALVLDVGTSGIKAAVFNQEKKILAKSYRVLKRDIQGNNVEQDPQEIIELSREVLMEVGREAHLDKENCLGMGLTTQRETVVVWDKETGEPVYPAIVWQDRRTEKRCEELKSNENWVRERTGLTINPYFSASKAEWILNNVSSKDLCIGTVDTWVMHNLLLDKPHLTDLTNASRTMLLNIRERGWDEELLNLWGVPREVMPEVRNPMSSFGYLDSSILGFSVPLVAVSGDQQASMYAALKDGIDTKVTYGTGTFLMQKINEYKLVDGFFTTLVPSLEGVDYALEAKIGSYGGEIDALLERKEPLDWAVERMTRETSKFIQKLPRKPERIILDGGITQAPTLLSMQQELDRDIEFVVREPFDGTALGVAEMVFDHVRGGSS